MAMFVKQLAYVAALMLSISAQLIFAATHTVTFTEDDLISLGLIPRSLLRLLEDERIYS